MNPPFDHLILILITRMIGIRNPGLQDEFSVAVGELRSQGPRLRRAFDESRNSLGSIVRLLFAGYFVGMGATALISLYVAMDWTVGAGMTALLQVALSALVGVFSSGAIIYGVLSQVRFRAPKGDQWGGTLTDSPVLSGLLVLATSIAWLAFILNVH